MSVIDIIPYSDDKHRNEVTALWREALGYKDAHNNPNLSIDKKIAQNDDLFFVAVIGVSVIGTIMAGYDGHRGWIYSVAIAPTYRRQGLGSRLIKHAERELIAKGCVKINLQLSEGNESVTEFYESLGYAVEKRICMGKKIAENIPPT